MQGRRKLFTLSISKINAPRPNLFDGFGSFDRVGPSVGFPSTHEFPGSFHSLPELFSPMTHWCGGYLNYGQFLRRNLSDPRFQLVIF